MNWNGRNDPLAGPGITVKATERLGVLGGTFDPPHNGHLALARAAQDALALTQMLFVPAADPPHKRGQAKTPAAARLGMLRCALQQEPGYCLSMLDMDRPGPHFAVDTLRLLREEHPDAPVWFVMGADSLRDLPDWHNPQQLIALCRLAVVPRPGFPVRPDMHENRIPGLVRRVDMIDSPLFPHASRDIAARLRAGDDLGGLVPRPVLHYIAEHGLYRPC